MPKIVVTALALAGIMWLCGTAARDEAVGVLAISFCVAVALILWWF